MKDLTPMNTKDNHSTDAPSADKPSTTSSPQCTANASPSASSPTKATTSTARKPRARGRDAHLSKLRTSPSVWVRVGKKKWHIPLALAYGESVEAHIKLHGKPNTLCLRTPSWLKGEITVWKMSEHGGKLPPLSARCPVCQYQAHMTVGSNNKQNNERHNNQAVRDKRKKKWKTLPPIR